MMKIFYENVLIHLWSLCAGCQFRVLMGTERTKLETCPECIICRNIFIKHIGSFQDKNSNFGIFPYFLLTIEFRLPFYDIFRNQMNLCRKHKQLKMSVNFPLILLILTLTSSLKKHILTISSLTPRVNEIQLACGISAYVEQLKSQLHTSTFYGNLALSIKIT